MKGRAPHVDSAALEDEIRAAIRTWDDGFLAELCARHGEMEGRLLFHDQAQGFPARYRDAFSPTQAVRDLRRSSALVRMPRCAGP